MLSVSLPSLLSDPDYHRQQTRQDEAELDRSALIGEGLPGLSLVNLPSHCRKSQPALSVSSLWQHDGGGDLPVY